MARLVRRPDAREHAWRRRCRRHHRATRSFNRGRIDVDEWDRRLVAADRAARRFGERAVSVGQLKPWLLAAAGCAVAGFLALRLLGRRNRSDRQLRGS